MKSAFPKLAGGRWPSSLESSGFGSKVSTWLGPPCIKRWITLLAEGGSRGFLGASGLESSSPAIRSKAANQPIPNPEFRRKFRLVASSQAPSVDIDELVHIEDQQTQPS